jgi:hypothetical protein
MDSERWIASRLCFPAFMQQYLRLRDIVTCSNITILGMKVFECAFLRLFAFGLNQYDNNKLL